MTPTPRHPAFRSVPDAQWNDWRWQLRHRITKLEQLEAVVDLTEEERRGIVARRSEFSFAITPYYLSLFGGPDCPVRRQAVPHADEVRTTPEDLADPLAEDAHAPVAALTHRYPDRALLYVSHTCPVYCRHCTRQRKVGDARSAPSRDDLDDAFAYLEKTPAVRDVLVSGGDPLSLSDDRLVEIVARLRRIPSVEIIRLCTRNPVTLPQRITPELLDRLRAYHPIYVNTHFNHPKEGTAEAAAALERLADAGFVVGNQMVLLAGINDRPEVVEALGRFLLRHRARPYYMFQCDPVRGTAHLRTPVERGVEIVDALRGRVSGLAIPHFAVDLPGGGGKVTLVPDRQLARTGRVRVFRGAQGAAHRVADPEANASSGAEGGPEPTCSSVRTRTPPR
ncbi:MAG: KamA family radical SAM protein [Deltaproteobacteria bacterium]|nr:MAG: KamA family radical SAM protein [Deltaproteobacteria bacterium]